MTTYTGGIVNRAIWPTVAPSSLSSTLYSLDKSSRLPFPPTLYLKGGTKTDVPNYVFPSPATKTGARALSFVDDYYDRIHILPAAIALGNLVSTVTKPFAIWNSWRVSRTMSSIGGAGTSGLSLQGLPATPFVMLPLQYSTYTLIAATEGPPTVNGYFSFVFAHGEQPKLTLTGQRILVFPYEPNWANGFTETLEWKTDVLRAYDGTEQRRALRIRPRRGFEYDMTATKTQASYLEHLLWGWGYRNFALPVWTDMTRLTADVAIGAVNLPANTIDYSFKIGDFVTVYQDAENYEASQVASVTNTNVGLQSPLTKAWPSGTRIYPSVVAHLPETVNMVRHTDNVLTSKLEFTTDPTKTDPFLPDAAAPTIYDGLEVITIQPNWKAPLNNGFTRMMEIADGDIGAIAYFVHESYPRIVRPFQWLLKNRSEIVGFRKFLQRMRGQVKTCWIPSWHDDFTLNGNMVSNSTTMPIAGRSFLDLVGLTTDRDRIMIVLNNGSIFYRKITGMSLSGNDTILGIDTSLGVAITPSSVKRIHIILKCRLAGDKVEIPWQTDSIATPQVVFTTVRA